MESWQLLGESQYRKWEVYGMCWEEEEVQIPMSVRGCENGGSIAVINPKDVTVYTAAGLKLVSLNFQVFDAGWTEDEDLVLVFDDGKVCLLSVLGQVKVPKFTLCEDGVLEVVEISGYSIVGLTKRMSLCICSDLRSEPKVIEARLQIEATALTMLLPKFTGGKRLEVFVATTDNSVLVVDGLSGVVEDQLLQSRFASPIIRLAIAPNGRFVACYTSSGLLTVMSSSFTTKVLDFDTATNVPPSQMLWCGEDSVILNWPGFLLMVGPFGHWLKFQYSHIEPRVLIPETDCCRIVSKKRCELLQRVPACVETIHRIGSTDLAAMLYDAVEIESDPKADENIRSLNNDLPHAIMTILKAALAELDNKSQQLYLKAAAYGKNFCKSRSSQDHTNTVLFPANEFVKTAQTLRVLNTLRAPPLAICLTAQQFENIGLDTVISRLLERQEYMRASAIVEYLGAPRDTILQHWATKAAEAGISAAEIKAKAPNFTIPASIAARQAGHSKLALQLLATEPLPSQEQVLALLTLQNESSAKKIAVRKAVATLNTDVVTYAILNTTEDDDNSVFAQKTRSYFSSDTNNTLQSTLQKAYASPVLSQRIDILKHTPSTAAAGAAGGDPFFAKAIEEQNDLLRIQNELEVKFQLKCFLDMSLAETLYNLIALNTPQATSEAFKLQRRFKLPEKHFYHLKIQALAASGQFETLSKFSAEKKSPIGYTPFIDACLQHGQSLNQCQQYIGKLPLHERFPFYLQLRAWNLALDVAYRTRDPSLLDDIQRAAASSPDAAHVTAQCDQYRAKLGFSS